MTRDELEQALAPIANATLESNDDEDVRLVSIVLAMIMGCLSKKVTARDRQALAALANHAGQICDIRQQETRGQRN